MRKVSIIILLLVISLGWFACKKSKNSTPTPDPVIARGMTAKINGVPWTADLSTMSYFSFGNYLEVYGYDTTGKTIELRITNFKTRGTFSVPQANDSIVYATDFAYFVDKVNATAGTIAIQAVTDTSVGGTFSFTATGVTVTEGTFNWNY